MSANVIPVFGKAIYEKRLDLKTREIVPLIDDAVKPFLDNKQSSKGQCYNSKDAFYVLEQDKFKFLKEIIRSEFKEYFHGALKYTNDFKITTSWFTILEETKKVQVHTHHNCFMSGVLYLQADKDSGDIVFQDFNDKRHSLVPTEYNIFNCTSWRFTPSDGLLLFFPAELYHSVDENKSNITRYSLAFNIIPIGTLGSEKNDSHYVSDKTLYE